MPSALRVSATSPAKKVRISRAVSDGETRTRTGDTTIFSRVLYQLSYLAAAEKRLARGWRRGGGSRAAGPGQQGGQRVDGLGACGRAPAARPDLEVQVRAVCIAGLADLGDRLAGRDRIGRRD